MTRPKCVRFLALVYCAANSNDYGEGIVPTIEGRLNACCATGGTGQGRKGCAGAVTAGPFFAGTFGGAGTDCFRAASGLQDQQIAHELGITPEKAARWRNRYLDGGINALEKDAARPGRPRTITESRTAEVIHKTTQEKPFNATHWSTRTMSAATGLSETTVRRIWRANGLKPHLVKTFKVSKDARFSEKLKVIVGLYLNPPEHAIVL